MTAASTGRRTRICTPRRIDRQASAPNPSAPLYHYIVIRDDLPLGLLAAQVAHAAGESSPGNLAAGTHVVVLAVHSALELGAVRARLIGARIPHTPIYESDPPYADQLMAIGVRPAPRDAVRSHLSSLPLLRERKDGAPSR